MAVSLSEIEAIDIGTVDVEAVRQMTGALAKQWNELRKVWPSVEIPRSRPMPPGYLEAISQATTVQRARTPSPRQTIFILIVVVIVIAWQYEGRMPLEVQTAVSRMVDAIGAIGGAVAIMDRISRQNKQR
jgi:hypothetical protein